jgi:hypothetical protein
MDIAEECDYTMQIGWAQNVPYLKCDHLNSGSKSFDVFRLGDRTGNGVVSVYVVNSLTVPGETPLPVTVNVYVSMCDDFEVQDPTGIGLENLAITEAFNPPPPIDPPDPGPPPQPSRGLLTYSNLGNLTGGLRISKATTNLSGDTGFVVRGNATDQTFSPGLIQFSNLVPGENNVRITFATNIIEPSSLTVDGDPVTWMSESDTSSIALYEFDPIVPEDGILVIDLQWADVGVLAVRSITVDRTVATGVISPGGPEFVELSPLVYLNNDEFGEFYYIPPTDYVVVSNPSVHIQNPLIAVEERTTVSFNGITRDYDVVGFPARSPDNISTTENTWKIVNEGTKPIKLYTLTWISQENVPTVFKTEGETEEISPERSNIIETAAGTDDNVPQVSDVFFGELPSSFRQVLRRYTLIRTLRSNPGEIKRYVLYANPRQTGRGQVRPADVSLIGWIQYPYLGWKGSFRHKIIPGGPTNCNVTMTRLARGSAYESQEAIPPEQDMNVSWEGTTTGFCNRQIAEAVIPWYSNLRFRNCRIGNPDPTFESAPAFVVEMLSLDNEPGILRQVCSAGEDLGLYYWVSTPIVNVYSS